MQRYSEARAVIYMQVKRHISISFVVGSVLVLSGCFDVNRKQHTLFDHIKTAIYICPDESGYAQIAQHYDLSLGGVDVRETNPDNRYMRYALYSTMTEFSAKADALRAYCAAQDLDIEQMYVHVRNDAVVELADFYTKKPELRVVCGWDPANDLNADGHVDAAEFVVRSNAEASARFPYESRVPIYYWDNDVNGGDFVLNMSSAAVVDFLIEFIAGETNGSDGVILDTLKSVFPQRQVLGNLLEYPGGKDAVDARWRSDMQTSLRRVRYAVFPKRIIGNNWYADPFIVHGRLVENWKDIGSTIDNFMRSPTGSANPEDLSTVAALDAADIAQVLQFNLYGDELLGVEPQDREREKMFGLAAYYLFHGDHTYFALGNHGKYGRTYEHWFDAIAFDIGKPRGDWFFWDAPSQDDSLVFNGQFEIDQDKDAKPDGWNICEPMVLDQRHAAEGACAVKIDSQVDINNVNAQEVTLEPHAEYTLTAWIKTEGVTGKGAQVYAYGTGDPEGTPYMVVLGTASWQLYRKTFTTGADPSAATVNFRLKGSGRAWFDDIRLTRDRNCEVLARRFEKALVLVRPRSTEDVGFDDTTAQAVELDGAYRVLQFDGNVGEVVERVNLRYGEAAILIVVSDEM